MKSLSSIWLYQVNVKLMVKISSFFVAFLENMDFLVFWNSLEFLNKLSVKKSTNLLLFSVMFRFFA